jgi:predicted phage terminase large subunit-like protein
MAAQTSEFELQRFVASLARNNLAVFAQRASPIVNGEPLMMNWHIHAITFKLEQVAAGKIKRLLIAIPPRCLKSYLASVCFPAWMLGRDPSKKIICASYANSLAEKLSTDTRSLMQSPWYRSTYPQTVLHPHKHAKEEFATTKTGFRMATSVGGTLTGRGGDIIVIDDPLKAGDTYSEAARNSCLDWYKTTVQSRLNNPKAGAIIVVAQRLHQQDLPGHLLETGDWDTLILPMEAPHDYEVEVLPGGKNGMVVQGTLLHPERHGPEELARIRREMGERDYEAQFNQAPLPPGGALFKRSWLKRYDAVMDSHFYEGVYQSWDTAYEVAENNDYSVCTTWGYIKGEFHLLDVLRKKLEFPDLQQAVLHMKRKWNPRAVIVEGIGSGASLYQNIRRTEEDPFWIKTLQPSKSKEHRASQQTVKFEQGRVFLPKEAPWLKDYEDELLSFPNGKHDDQVDSTVQFLAAADIGNLDGHSRAILQVR